MKRICCLLLSAFFVASCQLTIRQAGTEDFQEEFSPDCENVYKGTLPCADCAGIETRLTINKNKRYLYQTRYLGTEQTFTSTGNYTIKEGILTIQENNRPLYFLMGKEAAVLLDNDKKPVEGVLAPYYRLKKEKNRLRK